MKVKKLIPWVIVACVILALVLFFSVPRSLTAGDDVLYISVYSYEEDTFYEFHDAQEAAALASGLGAFRCRPVIDGNWTYYSDRARYDIHIYFARRGHFNVTVGEADPPGETSIMNKGYYPTALGNYVGPGLKLRYQLLDPEGLMDYLDTCLK